MYINDIIKKNPVVYYIRKSRVPYAVKGLRFKCIRGDAETVEGGACMRIRTKKRTGFYLGIVFAVLLVVTAAQSVGAFEEAQYFEDDYEDGKMNYFDYYNWDSLEEDGNTYICLPLSFTGIDKLELDYDYTDMDVMFDVRLDSVNSEVDANFGVSLRRGNEGNDQFDVAYQPLAKLLRIRLYEGGTPSDLATAEFEMETGKWYNMGIRLKGNQIEWYINGTLTVSAESDALDSGTFLIATYNAAVSLDNVKIAKVDYLNMANGEYVTRDPATATPAVTKKPSPTAVPSQEPAASAKTDAPSANKTIQPTAGGAVSDEGGDVGTIVMIIVIAAAIVIIGAVVVIICRRKGRNPNEKQ